MIMGPGSFCPASVLLLLVDRLQAERHILVVDCSGQYPNSASFISIQEEAEAVLQEIQWRGILSVQMVYGQSMEAEIGLTLMHLMENAGISVQSAFLDGMPAGSSYVLERFLLWKFRTFRKILVNKTPEEILSMPFMKRKSAIPELFLRSCSSFSRLPV